MLINILSKQKKLNHSKDHHTFCETELAKHTLKSTLNQLIFIVYALFTY